MSCSEINSDQVSTKELITCEIIPLDFFPKKKPRQEFQTVGGCRVETAC